MSSCQILEWGSVIPSVNQVEFHPYLLQRQLLYYCKSKGIVLQAYGSIAADGLLEDPVLNKLAKQNGRTPAQISLRHTLQLGAVVLPKSVTPARILQNAALFDFELNPDQMNLLNGLDRNERSYWDNTDVP